MREYNIGYKMGSLINIGVEVHQKIVIIFGCKFTLYACNKICCKILFYQVNYPSNSCIMKVGHYAYFYYPSLS